MRLRTRITLVFTLLATLLLFVSFEIIYFITNQHMQSEFFAQLKERTDIAEQYFLEEDELSANIYQEIRQRHLRKLPAEKEVVIPVDTTPLPLDTTQLRDLPDSFLDKLLKQGNAQLRTGETYYNGQRYEVDEGSYVVIVSAKNAYGASEIRNLRRVLLITFTVGIAVVYLLGFVFAGRILRPIASISDQVNSITAFNLHRRLEEVDQRDELGKLAHTFNGMLDRLETSFELQAQFINNASHELRNPLTAIISETDYYLERERRPEEYQEALRTISREATRLHLLTNSLLSLAQTSDGANSWSTTQVSLDEVLWEAQHLVDSKYPNNKVKYHLKYLPEDPKALLVMGNQDLLRVALANLIDNACKFSDNQLVEVTLERSADHLQIAVKDRGIGISEADLPRIFEPLYRADNARQQRGFGVGLSLTQKIIHIHEGSLRVQSTPTEGTEVCIVLPALKTLEVEQTRRGI